MNVIFRPLLLLIISIFGSAQFALTQEFPLTKKQVYDVLTASVWNIKWLVVEDRKLDAEMINMRVSINFMKDSTYVLNFMSETRKGKFTIDMEDKYIRLSSDKNSGEILISSLSVNELWAQSKNDGEIEPLMILVNGKKE